MLHRSMIIGAYTAAGLTIVAVILTPFVLINAFTRGIAALGVRVDPVSSGGEVAYTLPRGAYRIVVNHPVVPNAPLPQVPPFVQIAWEPISALPASVSDEVDVDGDGRPDLVARFAVPREPNAPLTADVQALTSRARSVSGIQRASFASLIARVGDRIVLRVPIR